LAVRPGGKFGCRQAIRATVSIYPLREPAGYSAPNDPGAIAGNSSIAGALELSQAIDTKISWLPGFSLFAYADYGAVWNPPGVGYGFASLSSLGFGIRTGIGERLFASALVAQPLWYDAELAALGVEQSTRYRFTVALRF
jgi:hemolysin activation/secretion protein